MQNIQVSRYEEPQGGYIGQIEPEGRNWILFIHEKDGPDLLVAEHKVISPDGDTDTVYVRPRPEVPSPTTIEQVIKHLKETEGAGYVTVDLAAQL